MKRLFSILLLTGLLCCCTANLRAEDKPVLPKDFETALNQPEDNFDIAVTALLLAKEQYPDIDIPAYLKKIDALSEELRGKLKDVKEPEKIVATVNDFFFKEKNFGLDTKDPDCLNPLNLYLNGVIDRKLGYCVSLSVAYLAITNRLKLPFYGVTLPRHFIVRYDDGKKQINVEATNKGAVYADEHYMKTFKIAPEEKSKVFKKADPRDIFASFFNNRGTILSQQRKYQEAEKELNRAIKLNANNPTYHYNLGNVLYLASKFPDAIKSYQNSVKLMPGYIDAWHNMGLSHRRLGNTKDALDCYDSLIKNAPELKYKGLSLKGFTYMEMAEFEKAVKCLEDSCAANPKFRKDNLLAMIACYLQLRKMDEASEIIAEVNNLGITIPKELQKQIDAVSE